VYSRKDPLSLSEQKKKGGFQALREYSSEREDEQRKLSRAQDSEH
jgi:hypothetical protein